MSFADELKKMAEDHIVSGSVGPLFDAGWAAACQFWAKKLGEMRLAGPSDEVILDAIVSSAMERGWSPSGSWAVAQGAIKRLAATDGGNK